MREKDLLIVLAASYDSVEAAEADYDAVKTMYDEAGVGHAFDAAVLEREADGKVKVVDKPWPPSCPGSAWGWGPRWARGSGPLPDISRTA